MTRALRLELAHIKNCLLLLNSALNLMKYLIVNLNVVDVPLSCSNNLST